MTARSRVIWFPDGRRVEVDPDAVLPPRPRVAIHGVKEPFRSHADGKWYDDHRTYEREVRARGLEIAGNEIQEFTATHKDPDVGDPTPDLVQTMKEAGVLS